MTTDATAEPEIVDAPAAATAVVAGVVPMAELGPFFDSTFTTLGRTLGEQGIAISGPAFALYHGAPAETADLEAGFPTAEPIEPTGSVRRSTLPAGRVARVVHRGSYDDLGSAWGRLRSWIEEQGLAPGPEMWEVYVTEPTPETDPADLRTELNWTLA